MAGGCLTLVKTVLVISCIAECMCTQKKDSLTCAEHEDMCVKYLFLPCINPHSQIAT